MRLANGQQALWSLFPSFWVDGFCFNLETSVFLCASLPDHRANVNMTGYQVYLSQYGGEEYILHAPRGDDLMSQNREGILSLAGKSIDLVQEV